MPSLEKRREKHGQVKKKHQEEPGLLLERRTMSIFTKRFTATYTENEHLQDIIPDKIPLLRHLVRYACIFK